MTGVQTCALPIWISHKLRHRRRNADSPSANADRADGRRFRPQIWAADLGRRFVMSIKMSYDKIIINLHHQSNQWLDGNTDSPSANADREGSRRLIADLGRRFVMQVMVG